MKVFLRVTSIVLFLISVLAAGLAFSGSFALISITGLLATFLYVYFAWPALALAVLCSKFADRQVLASIVKPYGAVLLALPFLAEVLIR